ncbi:outer membrane lipoprotein-sorting protein [Porticoccaceae bacterium LTM1]|nr:outer membrane lipoprotein-sorting protein [Porticoccaceae bacterium LTM1]
MKIFNLITVGLLASSIFISAQAQTPEEKGFEIAARSDRSDRGFGDSQVEMKMVLRNAAGGETSRTLQTKTLEVADESLGDESLIYFYTPADVEGTALLSHAKILDPDDQWLYLPALKRVKRISSANKSGPFVGSEFAFEDFTAQELNKFTYKFLRVESCPDLPELMCDVVERYPTYQKSGYSKQVSWIDQQDFQVRKLEFFDRRGDLLKTLRFNEYKKYEDGVWRAHLLSMANHKTGKSTDLVFSEYVFKAGLTEKDFSKGVLKRLR